MGRMEVGLHQNGCVTERIVVHELLHVLGFRHEHNRPDRDAHITMHWNNIKINKIIFSALLFGSVKEPRESLCLSVCPSGQSALKH